LHSSTITTSGETSATARVCCPLDLETPAGQGRDRLERGRR
jgi:hypothetical protein